MNVARYLPATDRVRNAAMVCEMGEWVHGLAPWQVIAHLTFAWEASLWSGTKAYEKFMRSELRGVSHFWALEANPGRDGFHVHALWVDCLSLRRSLIWQKWFARYGRGRIEPVNCRQDVADYVAKYVTKEGAWWGVRLMSHRISGEKASNVAELAI